MKEREKRGGKKKKEKRGIRENETVVEKEWKSGRKKEGRKEGRAKIQGKFGVLLVAASL